MNGDKKARQGTTHEMEGEQVLSEYDAGQRQNGEDDEYEGYGVAFWMSDEGNREGD